MKEQIKKEDLVKGEWYLIQSYENWLIKFDKIENNQFCVLNCCTPNDGYIHEINYGEFDNNKVIVLYKATKKEVLKYYPNEKFEDEFILPKNWYVEVPNDLENKILLNNWKIKQKYNDDLFENNQYAHVDFQGSGFTNLVLRRNYVEITFDQFKQYVLKIEKNNMENKKIIGYKLIKRIPGLQTGVVFTSKVDNEWIFENYNFNNEEIQDTEFFEPVYENEFKVGDWVTFWSEIDKKLYSSKIKEWTPHNYCKLENGLEPFKHLIKKATPEEIEKATEKVISMNGKFNLTIKNKKVYHKLEDITDYVLCIGETYNPYNLKHIYSRYDFCIKDMILSKTGCQSQETYLSHWLKVYELIK
jgi:hypothetical protein